MSLYDRTLTICSTQLILLLLLQAVKRQQVKIEIIPEDEEGGINLDALEGLLSNEAPKPALIAITHIPTSSGR